MLPKDLMLDLDVNALERPPERHKRLVDGRRDELWDKRKADRVHVRASKAGERRWFGQDRSRVEH